MTDEPSYRLGTGKHRLGNHRDQVRREIFIDPRQDSALDKLRCIKGLSKNDVILIGVDLALSLTPDDLVKRVQDRRTGRT